MKWKNWLFGRVAGSMQGSVGQVSDSWSDQIGHGISERDVASENELSQE